ncbi:shikimate dehydrogenase [Candidatus Pyrohabitans sp.]
MVDARTKVFAVIGSPVEHSLSPQMHNASFAELGLNCIYVAHRVEANELRDAVAGFKALKYGGVNVTLPHKQAVLSYVSELSDEARAIGAVNTLEFRKGRVVGHNTDGVGALNALREAGVEVDKKRVLIIGAGGAARAIAITLAMRCEVAGITLLGRTKEKLIALARDVERAGAGVTTALLGDDLRSVVEESDIVIHATPVGMHPRTEETLLRAEHLASKPVVMDIVYTPRETLLLREAKKAGCKTIDGVGMLVHQGAEAERIWLGVEPGVEAMRRAVLEALEDG